MRMSRRAVLRERPPPHGRARRQRIHSTSSTRTVAPSQSVRKGATMRCIASAFWLRSVSAVSFSCAVASLLFAEGTTTRARPPMGLIGSTPLRARIEAVTSDSWTTPSMRVEADARMPGA